MNDECGAWHQQQLQHLLFCIYVNPLWQVVKNICDFRITFDKIPQTEECQSPDRILTLILFLVYKEWLLLLLVDEKRYSNIMLAAYKNELVYILKFMRHPLVMILMKLSI